MALALLAVPDEPDEPDGPDGPEGHEGHEGHDEQEAEVEEAALAVGKAVVFVANAGETVAAAVGGACAG